MSNLPDHLRHAKHREPHPECAVCMAKELAALDKLLTRRTAPTVMTTRSQASQLGYVLGPATRQKPLTVSTEGVPVVSEDDEACRAFDAFDAFDLDEQERSRLVSLAREMAASGGWSAATAANALAMGLDSRLLRPFQTSNRFAR